MNHKQEIIEEVYKALRARDEIQAFEPKGEDEHIEISYKGIDYRIEISGPFAG